MADSYTGNLRVVQQVNGENAGVWGDRVDAAFEMLEDAISDVQAITLSATTKTLSTANNSADEARSAVLHFSGSPGGTCTVTIPDVDKVYLVNNGSDQSIILTKGSGTTLTLATLDRALVYCLAGTGVYAVRPAALTSLIGLASVADRFPYYTAANTFALGTITAAGLAILDDAAASDQRTTLGLVIGTDVAAESTVLKQGLATIWVPAAAMRPAVTSGCATLTAVETTAGRPDMVVLDFDDGADEYAQFSISMPKSWDEGTVTFQVFHTTTASDTDGVAWALQGVAVSDADTIDAAYGTAVVVTDDYQSAAEDLYVTAVSSAVTIAGTPAAGDLVFFQIFRDVSDANDDATEDARLIGVKIFFTTNAATDA